MELTVLKLVNMALRFEKDNILSAVEAKKDRLDELYEQIAALEPENAQLLARPSTSTASEYSNIL